MKTRNKPTVGQRLFSLNIGNADRRGVVQTLSPVIVKSVGRKYFVTQTDNQWKFEKEFRIEDWSERSEFCQNVKLYESEKEWQDEREEEAICTIVRDAFEYGRNKKNIPLDRLRKIAALIEGTDETAFNPTAQ